MLLYNWYPRKNQKVFRFFFCHAEKKSWGKQIGNNFKKVQKMNFCDPTKLSKHVQITYVHLEIKVDFTGIFRPTSTMLPLHFKFQKLFFKLAQRFAKLISKRRVPSRIDCTCPEVLANNFDFSFPFQVWKKLGVVLVVCW